MALILIVDDSPTEVHVMKKALEKSGYQTATAQDGAEGVQQMPAPAETRRAALLLACVHADLDRGGAAHHHPPPRATAVEELLHGCIARQVEHAPWGAERIETVPREAEPGGLDGPADSREVSAGGRHTSAQA